MKNIFKIIIILMTGLAGVFVFLALNEHIKGIVYNKEKELRAKKMKRNYDEMIAIINGSKPKMVKF